MALYYIEDGMVQEQKICIGGSLGHHLRKVLRCRLGEKMILVDQKHRKYWVMITQFEPKGLCGTIEKTEERLPQNGIEIILGQGMPKGKKFDMLLQKATELGVTSIFPLVCERSLFKVRSPHLDHDVQRWKSIVFEASQQSERWEPPFLFHPMTLSSFMENLPEFDLGLILWEKEKKINIRSLIHQQPLRKKILILVGPEGGFSEKEVQGLVNKGFISVSLGNRILRTETAGPFVVGLLQYEWGDIG